MGSSCAYEFKSPTTRKSGSRLCVGSVAIQLSSACAALLRVWLQLPWPSFKSGSLTSLQLEPFDFRWLTITVKRSPVAVSVNVWARDGRFLVSMKSGSKALVSSANEPVSDTLVGL